MINHNMFLIYNGGYNAICQRQNASILLFSPIIQSLRLFLVFIADDNDLQGADRLILKIVRQLKFCMLETKVFAEHILTPEG
jgi:hypothetical protein